MLNKLREKKFDLLVIGGGVTGAGISLDAQARGLSTALIEMQDFAAGTSSRSTKLIHGGLRYLKQFQFGVVAEVGKERAIVYENAPHITSPQWMLLPIVEGGTFGKNLTRFALTMYDALANVKKGERKKILNVEETLKLEPLLKKEDLKGGGYYVEYRTDDARLTIEVVKKAAELGAVLSNYTKMERFIYENGKVIGVRALDIISNEHFNIYAKQIVNASGIWVDEIRKLDNSLTGKRLFHTKGVHLVFDQSVFPLKQAVYFDTNDNRMVFAIPREGKTYLGTTDTKYEGDLAVPTITLADKEYLLKTVDKVFHNLHLKLEDIESEWSGVRPLIYEEGKKESEISRKDEIIHSDSLLITIAGGKLTGYRKMAEKVVDLVCNRLNVHVKSITKTLKLSGGDVGGSVGYEKFFNKLIPLFKEVGLKHKEAEILINRYGSNVEKILESIISVKNDSVNSLPPEIYAELKYCLENEMVMNAEDFLQRRSSATLFNKAWAEKWEPQISIAVNEYHES